MRKTPQNVMIPLNLGFRPRSWKTWPFFVSTCRFHCHDRRIVDRPRKKDNVTWASTLKSGLLPESNGITRVLACRPVFWFWMSTPSKSNTKSVCTKELLRVCELAFHIFNIGVNSHQFAHWCSEIFLKKVAHECDHKISASHSALYSCA